MGLSMPFGHAALHPLPDLAPLLINPWWGTCIHRCIALSLILHTWKIWVALHQFSWKHQTAENRVCAISSAFCCVIRHMQARCSDWVIISFCTSVVIVGYNHIPGAMTLKGGYNGFTCQSIHFFNQSFCISVHPNIEICLVDLHNVPCVTKSFQIFWKCELVWEVCIARDGMVSTKKKMPVCLGIFLIFITNIIWYGKVCHVLQKFTYTPDITGPICSTELRNIWYI